MAWSARSMASSRNDLFDVASREASTVLFEMLRAPLQGTSLEEIVHVFHEQKENNEAMLEGEADRIILRAKSTHDSLLKAEREHRNLESSLIRAKSLCQVVEGEEQKFSKKEIRILEELLRSSANTKRLIDEIEGLYDVVPLVKAIHRRLDDYNPGRTDLLALYIELFSTGPFRMFAYEYETEGKPCTSDEEMQKVHILHQIKREFEYCWRKFNAILWGHLSDYKRLSVDDPALLVRCVQCIRLQDMICERVELVEQKQKHRKEIMRKVTLTPTTEMGKEKCLAEFRSYIEEEFRSALKPELKEAPSLKQNLASASDLLDSIFHCYRSVEACFPPEYKIFEFFVSEYNQNFFDFFSGLSEKVDDISNGDILEVIGWCMDYDSGLLDLGVTARDLQPSLFTTLPKFYEKYCSRIVSSMENWILNIVRRDMEQPPMVAEDGKLHSLTWVDVFQIANDQIRLVDEIEEGGVLTSRISAIACHGISLYSSYCNDMVGKMQSGVLQPDLERACQIANDALHCIMQLGNVHKADSPLLLHGQDALRKVQEEFELTRQLTHNLFTTLVVQDILPLAKMLLLEDHLSAPPTSPMPSILATLDDYANDLHRFLHEDNFKCVMLSTAKSIACHYCASVLQAKCTRVEDYHCLIEKISSATDVDASMLLNYCGRQGIPDYGEYLSALIGDVRDFALAQTYEDFATYYSHLQCRYGIMPTSLLEKHLELGGLHLLESWPTSNHQELIQCMHDIQSGKSPECQSEGNSTCIFQIMDEILSSGKLRQSRWSLVKQRKNTLG